MVKPYTPFSLFDFKHITDFNEFKKILTAGAGAAIPLTTIYTCPPHKFALLLKCTVAVTKTTATALLVVIGRAARGLTSTTEVLISESAATGYFSWPSGKATNIHALGWCLEFMFPGDTIRLSHALTAAETIGDTISYVLIEYDDPRFKEEEE